jgi:phosphatidylinositol 4-kinase
LLKDETFRLHTWLSPLAADPHVGPVFLEETSWLTAVRVAWNVDPYLAVHLSERFVSVAMFKEIRRLILANPEDVIESPLAAQIMLGDSLASDLGFQLRVTSIGGLINCSICCIGHPLFLLRLLHTFFTRLVIIRWYCSMP